MKIAMFYWRVVPTAQFISGHCFTQVFFFAGEVPNSTSTHYLGDFDHRKVVLAKDRATEQRRAVKAWFKFAKCI